MKIAEVNFPEIRRMAWTENGTGSSEDVKVRNFFKKIIKIFYLEFSY